ncbi:MAG TPA: ion transporter [Thermomicrobiales bacterium]|nr:ion transporter [Thermomicrobiales bacterium]
MPPDPAPSHSEPERDQAINRERERVERFELLANIQAVLEPLMVVLGLVFLLLLVVDYGDLATGQGRAWLDRALWMIYVVFVADFVTRFVIAPSKSAFLRDNWLGALSLALPALRPLRALRALRGLRAARAARSLSLVRLLGGINRGMRVLRQVTRGERFAYISALSVAVVLLSAAGMYFFERAAPNTTIRTFGDALWWSSTVVTTINAEKYPVTVEGRIIGVLVRLFALSVFGLLTASIASYFIGKDAEQRAQVDPATREEAEGGATALQQEIAALRAEVVALRRDLVSQVREESPPAATDIS